MKTGEMLPKILFSIAVLVVILLISNCGSAATGHFHVQPNERKTNINREIIQFPDGTGIPEGYEYVTTAVFNTNSLLIYNCGRGTMIKEARSATFQAGGDAFRLYDVRPPNFITEMCYTGNILILRKKSVDD